MPFDWRKCLSRGEIRHLSAEGTSSLTLGYSLGVRAYMRLHYALGGMGVSTMGRGVVYIEVLKINHGRAYGIPPTFEDTT